MAPRFAQSIFGLLLHRLFLLLALYTALRFVFLLFHFNAFQVYDFSDLGLSFLRGLRFDAAALALINAPFVVFSLLPTKWLRNLRFQAALKIYFLLTNLAFLAFAIVDIEFYRFTGTRITTDLFFLRREAAAQGGQFILHYWYLLLLFIFCAVLLWRLYPKSKDPPRLFLPLSLGLRPLFVFLTVLAARGGAQLKVIKPIHAFQGGHQELGVLTLNTPFTLLKSRIKNPLERIEDFTSEKEIREILEPPTHAGNAWSPRPNIVILILESFSTEFWGVANGGQGYTPYLDQLARRGLFLRNHFANGRRSIEALPSIFFGIPTLMSLPLAKSNYQGNQWMGLGHYFARAGYHSSFFHGAKTGTMYFNAISEMAGVEDYYPLERYSGSPTDFDGAWGIFDEPFLQFMAEQLDNHPKPFISTVFTISTHQPFTVPRVYRSELPIGPQKIHQSVRYVDLAVEKFFKRIESAPWFKDTLFVITGDHTHYSLSGDFDSTLGRYMVPLLLFHPSKEIPKVDATRITQHADILPTLLEIAGIPRGKSPLFGRSIFSPEPGEAQLFSNGLYWLVQNDYVAELDPAGLEKLQTYAAEKTDFHSQDLTHLKELKDDRLRRLRAYRQHFNNGLIENSFYRQETRAEK